MARKTKSDTAQTNTLRFYRLKREMSQEQLAKLSGVHKNSIIRYEQGIQMPSMESAIRLCRVLGVTLDEMFGS